MPRTRTALAAPIPPLTSPSGAANDQLLDAVGPIDGARVLVIGHGALETMCALIRRGCTMATEMRGGDRLAPEADLADVVMVPHLESAVEAADAITRARRALTMGGSIALRDVSGGLHQTVAGLLRRAGFSAMRTRITRAGVIIVAERPMFGPLHSA